MVHLHANYKTSRISLQYHVPRQLAFKAGKISLQFWIPRQLAFKAGKNSSSIFGFKVVFVQLPMLGIHLFNVASVPRLCITYGILNRHSSYTVGYWSKPAYTTIIITI